VLNKHVAELAEPRIAELRKKQAELKDAKGKEAELQQVTKELREAEKDVLKLTYGPAKKDAYFNRFSVDGAKELEPLKEAYLKYVDRINLFEGRDMTPERLLKPGDFQKLFFDSSEPFSATSPYHAMPWPPKAKTNPARMWKEPNHRVIDQEQIRPADLLNFKQQMAQNDPLKAPPDLDLFKDAENPILFWRTVERIPERPSEYGEIERNLKKYRDDWVKTGAEAEKMEKVSADLDALRKKKADLEKAKAKEAEIAPLTKEIAGVAAQLSKMQRDAQGNVSALRARQVDLKEKEADLEEIKRLIVEGWRFEQARTEKALPRAEEIAKAFFNRQKTELEFVDAEAAKLKRERIVLEGLAQMYPERLPDNTIDYFKPPLPKGKIPFARDDTMDQAVRLLNLPEAIKIDNKALDDINKMLFDKTRAKENNPKGKYVQILTNKPRSVFYVAVVTLPARPNELRFNLTMLGIYNAMVDPDPQRGRLPRDHFAERIQQQDAKVFRANVVNYLHTTLGYELLKPETRKEFDDRGGGD